MRMILKSFKNRRTLNQGFTFIELIVVFSIIGILSTIGITSFVTYGHSQELSSVTSDLITTINLAKSRAQSQVKPSICDNDDLESYEVRLCGLGPSCNSGIKSPNFGYELDVWCGGYSYLVAGYNKELSSKITLDQSTTAASVIFPVLTGGINQGGKIVVNGYGQSKTIQINELGASSSSVSVTPVPTAITPIPTIQ